MHAARPGPLSRQTAVVLIPIIPLWSGRGANPTWAAFRERSRRSPIRPGSVGSRRSEKDWGREVIGEPGRLRRGIKAARPNNNKSVIPGRPRSPTANGWSLPSPDEGFPHEGACALIRVWRGSGAAARGPRVLPRGAGHRNGPAPPPRPAGPPRTCIVSEGQGPVYTHSGPSSRQARKDPATLGGGIGGPPGHVGTFLPD
jgi:hypothetical protein